MASITSYFNKKKTPEIVTESINASNQVQVTVVEDNSNSERCSLPCCRLSSPDPHRLQIDKECTARTYGKRKRYFQNDWLDKFSWLVLCKTDNRAFCQACRYASNSKMVNFSTHYRDQFINVGFSDWKDGLSKLSGHNKSDYHKQAVMSIAHQSKSIPVNQLVSKAQQKVHEDRRSCFIEMVNSIRFLVRQGIALRNKKNENSNLIQLLKLSSNPNMKKYLKENNYLSHDITSEIIKEMYRTVLENILAQIKGANFFAIVIDETRDISGIEQLSVVIRWVSQDYIVYEDIIGFHQADVCNAESLVKIIKTALLSVGLDIKQLRGQTYDGASVLQGHKSGVAKQILSLNQKALSTHCLNHNLNLVLQEAASKNTIVNGAFTAVQSVCSVIRASPKRLAYFRSIQLQSPPGDMPVHATSLKPLCETRWTCRTASLTSILNNYEVILETLEKVSNEGGPSKAAREAPQLISYLEKFGTVFGLRMSLTLFSAVEDMATQLQSKSLDASLVKTVKNGLIRYLQDLRSETHFLEIFKTATEMCEDLGLQLPVLPRRKRMPKRLEDYVGVRNPDHGCETPEDFYKGHFYSVIDLMVEKIEDRFNQDTLNYLIELEDLVISAANGNDFTLSDKFKVIVDGDVEISKLNSELTLLAAYTKEVKPSVKEVTSVQTVLDVMKEGKLNKVFSELHTLLRLYLTIPLSNASAERSFSALRRIKTYLRSTLTQEHLNHYLILHAHRELLDMVHTSETAAVVMKQNERRKGYFGY